MDSIYISKDRIIFFSGYSLGIAFAKIYEKKDFQEIIICEKKDNFGKFIQIYIPNKNKYNSKTSIFTKELNLKGIEKQFAKFNLKIKIQK